MKTLYYFCFTLFFSFSNTLIAQIIPGKQIFDMSGKPIHSNSGDILKSGKYWYWFGEDDSEYTWPCTIPGASQWYADFNHVSCYRSVDLVNWEFRGNVLSKEKSEVEYLGNIRYEVSRPHVVWNAKTKKWIMYYHAEDITYTENMVGVAVCDSIDGKYKFVKKYRPNSMHSLDMGLYKEGNDCYIIYSNYNKRVSIDKLTDDYLEVSHNVVTINEPGEAPVIFKRKNVYFLVNSQLSGWSPNANYYRTAKSLSGPWSEKMGLAPNSTNTYGSQVFEIIQVDEGKVDGEMPGYIYIGDLFDLKNFANCKTLWLPLKFSSDSVACIDWRDSLSIQIVKK